MSGPPPEDLMKWPKADLAKEVRRQRAVLKAYAETPAGDPRSVQAAPNAIVDPTGDPHAHGGVLLNTTNAVLLDATDVSLVDTKRDSEDPVVAFVVLSGRVNYAADRVSHGYMMTADGAAALVTQLVALAARAKDHPDTEPFCMEFDEAFTRRIDELESSL